MKALLIITLQIFFGIGFVSAQNRGKNITIKGHSVFIHPGDTISMLVYTGGLQHSEQIFCKTLSYRAKSNDFSFTWLGEQFPQMITLQFHKNSIADLNGIYVKKGDRINLYFGSKKLVVKENHRSDFKIQSDLKMMENNFIGENVNYTSFDETSLQLIFKQQDSLLNLMLKYLETNKSRTTNNMYKWLKNDLRYSFYADQYRYLYYAGRSLNASLIKKFKNYKNEHPEVYVDEETINPNLPGYVSYKYFKYLADSCYFTGKPFNLKNYLVCVSNSCSGTLREELIIEGLIRNKNFPIDIKSAIEQAIKFVNNKDYFNYAEAVLSRVDGAYAYDFSLTDVQGKKIHLSDFKDKVVVLDFWYTGCGNCLQLAPYLKKSEEIFKNESVVFIGVSIDENLATWLRSVKQGNYVSSEIINGYSNGLGRKDPVVSHYHVSDYPTLVLISKEGKIVNIKTDPRNDNGLNLNTLIRECLN